MCAEKTCVCKNDTWHVLKKLWQFSDVPAPRKVRINVAVYVQRGERQSVGPYRSMLEIEKKIMFQVMMMCAWWGWRIAKVSD